MHITEDIQQALVLIEKGGVIAYPTEAVYGLGCDPFNETAVNQLLALKKRSVSAGLILLIAHWEQLDELIAPISETQRETVQKTWPGHTTWLFPKSPKIPAWISGKHDRVGIRMTAHPVARALCETNPIVSSSANITGQEAARTVEQIHLQFTDGIDLVVSGQLGGEQNPSIIIELSSLQKIR